MTSSYERLLSAVTLSMVASVCPHAAAALGAALINVAKVNRAASPIRDLARDGLFLPGDKFCRFTTVHGPALSW